MLETDFNLRQFNTFGIDVSAEAFAIVDTLDQLTDLVINEFPKYPMRLILGGGSNMLFTRNYSGIVVKMNFKGIEELPYCGGNILVKAAAGEIWNDLVDYCVEHGYGGIENLALIPGLVGASPVQNIGAYGVELKDVFYSLRAMEIATGKMVELFYDDCQFAYRDSFFKKTGRNKYIITSVTLKLSLHPVLKLNYGAIKDEIEKGRKLHVPYLTNEYQLAEVRDAVVRIRSSKLPDPVEIGNAGSFFKNPTVSLEDFNRLKQKNALLPAYPQADGSMKLAAGWLIEQCGWKGYRNSNAGVHQNQALVIVNYGNATGLEILELSQKIQESVLDKFGVKLDSEVNIW